MVLFTVRAEHTANMASRTRKSGLDRLIYSLLGFCVLCGIGVILYWYSYDPPLDTLLPVSVPQEPAAQLIVGTAIAVLAMVGISLALLRP